MPEIAIIYLLYFKGLSLLFLNVPQAGSGHELEVLVEYLVLLCQFLIRSVLVSTLLLSAKTASSLSPFLLVAVTPPTNPPSFRVG